jgi:integrase
MTDEAWSNSPAPATVNRELAFLRRVFNVAIADGFADTNPVQPRMFAKEDNARVRYLTDDEEKRLREVIGTDEWPKVAVALHTGARQGNQFRLRCEDVDFASGHITLRRPKNRRTYHVPMNETLRDVLRKMPSRLKSEYVFPSSTGVTPLDPRNWLREVFRPALLRAKIASLRWHDLRHTFASRLVMRGTDMRTVQELMGHETIDMTQRYAHLSPQHLRAAVQRLNKLELTPLLTPKRRRKKLRSVRVRKSSSCRWKRARPEGFEPPTLRSEDRSIA